MIVRMTSQANYQVWVEPSYRALLVDDVKLTFHRWKLQFARRHRDRLLAASFTLGIAADLMGVLAEFRR
jgi:hypothetical protein